MRTDYNLTKYQVFREVSVRGFQEYAQTQVLAYVWQSAHLDSTYPSCIRRWDLRGAGPVAEHVPTHFNAAGGTNFQYRLDASTETLIVHGLSLGAVSASGPSWELRRTASEIHSSGSGFSGPSVKLLWLIWRIISPNYMDMQYRLCIVSHVVSEKSARG